MKHRMGEMERFYFQMARGRAIVRRNRMKDARAAKSLGELFMVKHYVAWARRANRDWRYYRTEMRVWRDLEG